jgi:hypothetical protein
MARWHRRILHSEGPTGTAHDRTIERTAIEAAGLGIYDLGAVRRGLGAERIIAYLHGIGRGIGPCASTCLDLTTGEELVISSTDPDVEARKLRVTDLPLALLAAWPRDAAGRPRRPGFNHSGRGDTVDVDELRQVARRAGADAEPAQGTLF